MSIQSEIERLQGVKSGIKNAIVESGIDVPDGTPFTDYADKTSQIIGQFDTKLDEIIGGEIVPMLDVQQRLEAINGVSGDVATQLDTLDSTKAAIASAITKKGVEVPEGTTFQEYAEKIGEIEQSSGMPPKVFTLYVDETDPRIDPSESYSEATYSNGTYYFTFELPTEYFAVALFTDSFPSMDGGLCTTTGSGYVTKSLGVPSGTYSISFDGWYVSVRITDPMGQANGSEFQLYIIP